MSVAVNPYPHHQIQLGVLETGLKSLKNERTLSYPGNEFRLPVLNEPARGLPVSGVYALEMERSGYLELQRYINGKRMNCSFKELMSDQEFSGMYWAIERHHRDLKLAHLTGQAKDIMDQAQKDTKFYNILIKMLCEVKKLPMKKQRESLKKVHMWYKGNRHTLQLGPRFGKTSQKLEAEDMLKNAKNAAKTRKTSAKQNSEFSVQSSTAKNRNQSAKIKGRLKNGHKGGDFRQFISDNRDEQDDVSTPHGQRDSAYPLSDFASSYAGNDFLTSRFLSELPTSKLSWNLDSPVGKSPYENVQTPTDWEGTEAELQRIQDSSLSAPVFSDHFHHSRVSAPNSSPRSHDGSHDNNSVVSQDSDGNVSSRVDAGSMDMMDFSSDVRRRLSRGQTPSASLRPGGMSGMSPDESSTGVYGLQKRMVHSIASLVNPHAKLAETEAKRAEQEYYQSQSATKRPATTSGSKLSGSSSDLSSRTPILKAVSVSGTNKMDAIQNFNSFSKDHLYGQDILKLSFHDCSFKMPPILKGKLNFVGRSGTALDVRYCAHDQGDMPENHTKELINLYSIINDDNEIDSDVIKNEGNIHDQTLEDFYQTADTIYPTHLPKYRGSSAVRDRIKSAPARRAKSAKPFKTPLITDKDAKQEKKGSSKGHRTPGGKTSQLSGDGDKENTDQFHQRPKSAVRLDTVVNMIDSVKDEMNFFKEKLAPTPMPGFRQPAHVGVPTKPLSRPATARSGKSIPRDRSPSPQQRPGTPVEQQENLMMGDGEVHVNTYQPNAFPARPHSATVNRAVDWRGKVTPNNGKYKSKTRFGGHSYVQKMRPSLRSAGAVTGKRPKTAPVNIRDKWKSEKEDAPITLPEVQIQNYPGIVNAIPYPYYPVKRQEPPGIVITENEKITRVPQAVSNTVMELDQKDVDTMLNITYLTGHSDSRFGSMGSLYLDEDFLRSISSRYTPVSTMSINQNTAAKEYLSLIGPMPLTPTGGGSRAQSRQGQRKPDAVIDQIPEESTVREDSVQADAGREQTNQEVGQRDQETGREIYAQADVTEQGVEETDQVLDSKEEQGTEQVQEYPNLSKVEIHDETEEGKVDTDQTQTEEQAKFAREPVIVQSEDKEDGDVHIEVTAIPASGRPLTPPQGHAVELERLSKSEPWQFQPELETGGDSNVDFVNTEEDSFIYPSVHYREHWSKNIVRPENYCFHCIPNSMTSKVGRSAGRTPGGIQSPAGQVLRMARKQNEYFKKAPPVRTPPSIPSPHHPLGGRSPRTGQQYISELEHHARKIKSPRHYMEQVVELRKDNCHSAPAGSRMEEENNMASALNVISLRTPGRARTAPTMHGIRQSETLIALQPFPEIAEEDTTEAPPNTVSSRKERVRTQPPSTAPTTSQSIAHIGRPIAQVSNIPDPTEEEEAVIKQKEAKAAVDIQRIFRGYVCRSSYNKLLWENRKKAEDKQMVAVETHREFRKHQDRKAKIYNRPPLDPALLQWAKDFKQIQTQHHEKRQEKKDILARELLANQQKQKSKIELIGPHVEIYDIYHPKEIGPTRREMHVAAVIIEKHARGFLVRRRMEKLRRKATFCGSTWKKMVKEYKSQLIRVQRWYGVERPKTPFNFEEMGDYMDKRRRYESQFDKKSFADELELSELENFFRECDLYPSNSEIEDGIDVIFQGRSLKGHGLKKQEAMNLLFYIYVLPATGLKNTRQSTWMNPIIDGVEAKKLLGTEFIEPAPLDVCANMVISSRRERKEKEELIKQKQLEEKEKKMEEDRRSNQSYKSQRSNTSDDLKKVGKTRTTVNGSEKNLSSKTSKLKK